MEHPLINDIGKLDEGEILDKITEINSKLSMAMRMGNSSLINQLQMALNTYQNKLAEITAEARRNKDDKFEDKIDIS
jgi:hypothetical protein